MSDFHRLTISDIQKETPNSVSIAFQIPDALKEVFAFSAGQHITIKHHIDGNEVRRAYSICTSPESGIVKVGVKKVAGGIFSVYANDILKVGDSLEVMPPEGKFVLALASEGLNYAAFAAGSGITPVLSIITSALESQLESTFVLVYGNRSLEETMFYGPLQALKEKYPTRFSVEYIFSRKKESNASFGRIEKSSVNYLLKNKYGETNFDRFYLCGPEPMIDAVTKTLKGRGVAEENILFELFTTSEEGELTEAHDGNTKITITLDDEIESFVMPQTTSVLQAVLDQGLDAPYSCQGGICSTCIARVTEGKVEMRKNQILTDSEVAEGLVLTCQSHPTTPTLVVDYDDV